MYEQLMGELAGYAGSEGLRPSDLLGLPDTLRGLVTWLARRGEVGPADLAAHIGCDAGAATDLAQVLLARGIISADGEGRYRVRLVGRRPRASSKE